MEFLSQSKQPPSKLSKNLNLNRKPSCNTLRSFLPKLLRLLVKEFYSVFAIGDPMKTQVGWIYSIIFGVKFAQPQIYIFDNENNKKVSLERKNFIKYLGLLIDENLSWKTNINSVPTKVSKTIGLITRLRHIVPSCTLLNIYQSLIVPYITYGLISWGNACKTFLDQIHVLQKRALRLIYFAETNDHAIPFFVKAKIKSLKSLARWQ